MKVYTFKTRYDIEGPGVLVYVCNPSYMVAEIGESWYKAGQGKSVRSHLKNKTKTKKAGGMAQMVKCLPSKPEALSSTLILPKQESVKKESWGKVPIGTDFVCIVCDFRKFLAVCFLCNGDNKLQVSSMMTFTWKSWDPFQPWWWATDRAPGLGKETRRVKCSSL
jgi:hypothetical protein